MQAFNSFEYPSIYPTLMAKAKELDFDMAADPHFGNLLKTLVASKPKGLLLELGTGIGSSLCWMQEGLDVGSKLITVDNDPQLSKLANHFFGKDNRLEIVCADGYDWIPNYSGAPFDLIFADAWPGKLNLLEETLALVKVGGLYVIDDMLPQPSWPEGHQERIDALFQELSNRKDFCGSLLNWSTGIMILTRIA